MKKSIRSIAIILSILFIITSFSGCRFLDEMRQNHAIFALNSEGSHIISYNNFEYCLIDSPQNLSPIINDDSPLIYATEEDAPLLLSFFIGETYNISADGVFLVNDYSEEQTIYCRSDKFKDISALIQNGVKTDNYCFIYYEYNFADDYFKEKRILLSDKENNAINELLQRSKPTVLPDFANISYDHSIDIYRCSSDMLFIEYYINLVTVDDKYYLLTENGNESLIIEIEEPYKSSLENIVGTVSEADNAYYDSLYGEYSEYSEDY